MWIWLKMAVCCFKEHPVLLLVKHRCKCEVWASFYLQKVITFWSIWNVLFFYMRLYHRLLSVDNFWCYSSLSRLRAITTMRQLHEAWDRPILPHKTSLQNALALSSMLSGITGSFVESSKHRGGTSSSELSSFQVRMQDHDCTKNMELSRVVSMLHFFSSNTLRKLLFAR